ncbi:expressed unknown protein [Seminavis robusta]|uniref:Uncharacterized protein n=1 Tax=Seminavis robusta TaxID=568900 RepID=A0A9N8HUU5_9STRA|nr:expressed unknown protein [Seminavis robusta]|eukprot:Sro1811_g299200.1 n/a (324) ;mRNA; f:11505-12476
MTPQTHATTQPRASGRNPLPRHDPRLALPLQPQPKHSHKPTKPEMKEEIRPMQTITDRLVVEAVLGLPQMKDKTLLHLAVVGSRSKAIASKDSDYDVKAVVLHSVADYLLQNITPSKAFETSIVDPETGEVVEVEGTLVDYLTMQKYALSTNTAACEAFYGLVIHQTPESEYLKELFLKAYDPRVLVLSYQGLLKHELKKARKQGRSGQIKHAANMVFYASMVHLASSSQEPPIQNAFQHVQSLQIDPALRENMLVLYRQRMADKSRTDADTAPFAAFLQNAEELEAPPCIKSKDEIESLRAEANARFVETIASDRMEVPVLR